VKQRSHSSVPPVLTRNVLLS